MKKISLLCLVVALCMMLIVPVMAAEAGGTTQGGFEWSLKDGVLTISGDGVMMFDPLPAAANKEYPPWFEYRSDVKEVVVKPGVTGFDYRAFQHCKNMTKITLPDTLQAIGSQMFHGCDSLTSLEIPNGVTTIDSMAFDSCISLKSITIPESVTFIKDEAFVGCAALEEVSIIGSPKIAYACFEGCESLKTVKFYGDMSVWDSMCFNAVTATVYYPAGNSTWSQDKLNDYGGKLTWTPFCDNHNEVTDAAEVAGCTTEGKTAGAHCSKCGVVTKAQQVIPATGHSFGDWKQTKAPTVQAAGQETRSCKNCTAVENREIPKLTQQPSGQDPTEPKPTTPQQTTPAPTDPEETVPPTVPDSTQPESTQPQQTQPEGTTATDPKEDPTQPDAPEQEAPKSTPWIAIAIAGGMILAGGGAAAWYFVLRKRK